MALVLTEILLLTVIELVNVNTYINTSMVNPFVQYIKYAAVNSIIQ